ncbi:MAG: double-strand break repair protein AddB [Parvularculaceae bacterium]
MTGKVASLFSISKPRLFTAASSRPCLDDIATHLLAQYQERLHDLPEVIIFLPTRRAARELEEAFLRTAVAASGATLLPRIRALGDVSDEDVFSSDLDAPDLPPSISPLDRRLTLARLVYTFFDRAHPGQTSWSTALSAADELSKLLDSFHAEEIDTVKLGELVPEAYADHWQKSLDFLKIITHAWPAFLQSAGRMDPAERRRKQIERLTQKWYDAPPETPVIIAGSTGSMPAVAKLMACVASLPMGVVILPGLDTDLDEEGWAQIDDPHPQAGLKHLLDQHFAQLDRATIPTLMAESETLAQRQRFLSLALRPAEATSDWLHRLNNFGDDTAFESAISGLHLVETPDEDCEARVIALLMREVLESPGKTASLVTPDRDLSRRVAIILQRWDIHIDESAGVPFLNTVRGTFLRLIARWLDDVSDPVRLLAVLKHPLYQGLEAAPLALVGTLDLALRGLRPGPGFSGLKDRIKHGRDWDRLIREDSGERDENRALDQSDILTLIEALEQATRDFNPEASDPAAQLDAHIQIAESFAGADWLWAYEDGRAGAALISQLREALAEKGMAGFAGTHNDYGELFEALCQGVPVRPPGGTHPRLAILGPLEARLLKADRMILGGLNEGVWPDAADTDPFLSRQMRTELGLPSPEQRIGLAARDFAELATGREVFLTRAKRAARAPTKPSRWIIRLRNILTARQAIEHVDISQKQLALVKLLDNAPTPQLASKPSPTPSADIRPTRLAVTQIETLMRDPYTIFASKILGLRQLDPLNADTTLAMRGQLFHHLFAQYNLDHPRAPAKDPAAILTEMANTLFAKVGLPPAVQAFWRGRMMESFAWFADWDKDLRKLGQPVVIEEQGATVVPVPGIPGFTLTARADRIDLLSNGKAMIYDYKTTAPPSLKESGSFSPQLQLTALIVEAGGFEDLPACSVEGFSFVRVIGNNMAKPVQAQTGSDAHDQISKAQQHLIDLLALFADPSTPYLSQPRPKFTKAYGAFDHLARRSEWAILGENEGITS